MRAALSYRDVAQPSRAFAGFDPDAPQAGLYRMRLRSGGVAVGIRIWFGAPLDPVTGEEMDRGWRWQAVANERPIDLERVWPKCADAPIDRAEYDHLTTLQQWGEANAIACVADPTKAVSPLQSPMMF